MNLYQVISVIPRRVKGVNGYFTAPDGFVVYAAYHRAKTPKEAIESAKSYYMRKEARKGRIRAEMVG